MQGRLMIESHDVETLKEGDRDRGHRRVPQLKRETRKATSMRFTAGPVLGSSCCGHVSKSFDRRTVVSMIRVAADLYVKIYRSRRVARLVNYARMRRVIRVDPGKAW